LTGVDLLYNECWGDPLPNFCITNPDTTKGNCVCDNSRYYSEDLTNPGGSSTCVPYCYVDWETDTGSPNTDNECWPSTASGSGIYDDTEISSV